MLATAGPPPAVSPAPQASLATAGGVSPSNQAAFRLRMIEASLTKCRRLGFSLDWTLAAGVVVADETQIDFVDFLLKHDLANVLADPTIVTVAGRSAEFFSGGQVPIGEPAPGKSREFVEIGTRATIRYVQLDGDRVRAEIRLRVTTLDESRSIDSPTGLRPALKSREIDTGIDVASGETVMLAGLRSRFAGVGYGDDGENADETVLIVLVTPELIDSQAADAR